MVTNTLPVSDRAERAGNALWAERLVGSTSEDYRRAFSKFEREITQSTADRVVALEAENARLREAVKEERDRNQKLASRNSQLSGALESQPPISLDAGEWFYPEDDTSSDACLFSPYEVVDYAMEGMDEGDSRVVVIQRAVQLPEIYAAVHVFTEAEKDARDDDEDSAFTLHATLDEARGALQHGDSNDGE